MSISLSGRRKPRTARVGSAIGLTLFLVSALVMYPIFMRMNSNSKKRKNGPTYVIESRWESADGDSAHGKVADASEPKITHWRRIDDLDGELAQFETVFWEPDDTASLRSWLHESERVAGRSVLEIGTGTGLIALVCKTLGAEIVVATDINPGAIACAHYNHRNLGIGPIEFRQVASEQPSAFAVVGPVEQFDLIISNPPWEDAPVTEVAAHAFYDPGFALLDGIFAESAKHLKPGGHVLLAYGAKTAILRIQSEAPNYGWSVALHDERDLADLPEVFLPGMLLELTRAVQ